MIRLSQPAPLTCETTPAHVTAVSARFALPVTTAGVRRVPLLGSPIVYACREAGAA